MRVLHILDHTTEILQKKMTESANFRLGAELTWMGIICSRAALLDTPNCVGLHCSNSDSKTSHFTGFVRLLLPFYKRIFHNVGFK